MPYYSRARAFRQSFFGQHVVMGRLPVSRRAEVELFENAIVNATIVSGKLGH